MVKLVDPYILRLLESEYINNTRRMQRRGDVSSETTISPLEIVHTEVWGVSFVLTNGLQGAVYAYKNPDFALIRDALIAAQHGKTSLQLKTIQSRRKDGFLFVMGWA